MFWKVYTTPGPPLTRTENAVGTVVTVAVIVLWVFGAVITRNGDWIDKFVKRPEDK